MYEKPKVEKRKQKFMYEQTDKESYRANIQFSNHQNTLKRMINLSEKAKNISIHIKYVYVYVFSSDGQTDIDRIFNKKRFGKI